MKLGVACLYGEGCSAAPALASEMLMRAEQLAGPNDPFSWLLYRPPWSSDTCSKALIFKDMLALVDEHQGLVSKRYSGIMYCVAKTLWYAYSRHSCCPCLPLLPAEPAIPARARFVTPECVASVLEAIRHHLFMCDALHRPKLTTPLLRLSPSSGCSTTKSRDKREKSGSSLQPSVGVERLLSKCSKSWRRVPCATSHSVSRASDTCGTTGSRPHTTCR